MFFRILGHDVTTRQRVELRVEADSPDAARRAAALLGIGAESVSAANESRSDEPLLVRMEQGYVQTIQLTSKPWKAALLISLILLASGVGACSWAVISDPRAITDPPTLSAVGATLALLGLAGVIFARLGAWWKHG